MKTAVMGRLKRIFWGETLGARARRWLWVLALGLLILAAFLLWRSTWPVFATEPPIVEFAGGDPEVAEAIERARQTVRRQPRSGLSWGQLGMLLTAHNFKTEAKVCFAQAEILTPKDNRWPYLHGLLLFTEDPEAALHELRRAAAIDGGTEEVRLRLAEILLEQELIDEADGYFRQALEENPANRRAQLGSARVAFARNDFDGCRKQLASLMNTPWTRKASHILLAEIQRRQGDKVAAAETARLVGSLPEDALWADSIKEQVVELRVGKELGREQLRQRVHTLTREGRIEEAAVLLRRNLRSDPDDGLAWNLLGQMLMERKEFAAADEAFQTASRVMPGLAAAQFYRGLLLMQQEKYPEATACFRKTIALQPGLGAAHHSLGSCLLHEGDRAGAGAAFRQAVLCEPQVAQGHVELAEFLANEGQVAEALLHLRDALLLEPANHKAQELRERIANRDRSLPVRTTPAGTTPPGGRPE